MARPEYDGVIAVFDNGHLAQINYWWFSTDGNRWRDKIGEWGIFNYKDRWWHCNAPPSGGSKKFQLHCAACLDNDCGKSLLSAPHQEGGRVGKNFTEGLKISVISHESVKPRDHHDDCPCHEDNPPVTRSSTGAVRQENLFSEVIYKMSKNPPHTVSGLIEIDNPFEDTSDLVLLSVEIKNILDKLKDENIIHDINKKIIGNNLSFNFKLLKIPPEISYSLSLNFGPDANNQRFHIGFSKNVLRNNLRFWKRGTGSDLIPFTLLGKSPEKLHLSNNSEDIFFFDPIRQQNSKFNFTGTTEHPIGDNNYNHPISNNIFRTKEGELREKLANYSNLKDDFGLELVRDGLVKAELFNLDSDKGKFLLILKNPRGDKASVRMIFMPFYRGLTESEINSENHIAKNYSDGLSNIDVGMLLPSENLNPGEIKYIFLKLEGTGEFQCRQQTPVNELIFTKSCTGSNESDTVPHSISKTKNNFNFAKGNQMTQTIRKILSNINLSNFDDWECPNLLAHEKSDSIPREIVVDLLRHRYTQAITNNNSDGISPGILTRITNIMTRLSPEMVNSVSYYLDPLGEFDRIKKPNLIETDPDDIFSEPKPRIFRIKARKSGYFEIDDKSSLIFDHRSSSQLKIDFPIIDEIRHLPSGHRLIDTEILVGLNFEKFNEYPDCRKMPKDPVDLLRSCFSDPNLFDKIDWSDWESRYLNIGCDEFRMPFDIKWANSLKREYQEIEGWTRKISSAIEVMPLRPKDGIYVEPISHKRTDLRKDREVYVIEQLFRSSNDNDKDEYSKPYLRAFRLTRIIGGLKDSVVLFDPNKSKVSLYPFEKYLDSRHPDIIRMGDRIDVLRDIIRAYVCSVNKSTNVHRFTESLVPYTLCAHLKYDWGLVSSIEKNISVDASKNLANSINGYLWLH
jgi:hypothetical protein